MLRKHPIFNDLDSEALDQLCRYAKHTVLKRGTTLFAKDDPGNSLYVVISGSVKISVSSPDGRNAILNLVGRGEVFGEMAVLEAGGKRSASAISVGPVSFAVLPGPGLRQRLASGNVATLKIAHGLARLLARRLGEANTRLVQVLQSGKPDESVAEAQRALGQDTAT